MTWGGNLFPLLIITSGGGFTGLFVYSPGPGAGHLIASIAAQAGTDPYGNAYIAGIISYSPAPAGVNRADGLVGGSLIYYSSPDNSNGAGPWTIAGNLSLAGVTGSEFLSIANFPTGILQLQTLVQASQNASVLRVNNTLSAPTSPAFEIISTGSGDKALGIIVNGDTNSRFTSDSTGLLGWGTGSATVDVHLSRPAVGVLMTEDIEAEVSSARETWHNLGAPIAGWSVSLAQYKRLADSGLVLVEISNLVGPAVPPADATVIFTAANGLPAGYRPSITSAVVRRACYILAGEGGEQPALLFATDGSIQVFGVGGTGANPRLDGSFTISTL